MASNPIRDILEDAGWTPSELASLLGKSQNTLSAYWNGYRPWTDKLVNDLVDALERDKGTDVRAELVERIRRAAGE